MAFYVEVFKSGKETKDFIYYIYQFSCPTSKVEMANGKIRYKSKKVCGTLKIDKGSGDVHAVELAEGDDGAHAKRAAWALIREWKEGVLPERTCWAS